MHFEEVEECNESDNDEVRSMVPNEFEEKGVKALSIASSAFSATSKHDLETLSYNEDLEVAEFKHTSMENVINKVV